MAGFTSMRRQNCPAVLVPILLAISIVFVSAAEQRPAWLTELSVGVRESYDNNVYLSGVNQWDLPAGSGETLKDRRSFVTIVSPRIGLDLAPLAREQQWLKFLTLAYAPEYAIYHAVPEESYQAHRFLFGTQGSAGAFSFNADNAFTYIHGSALGPAYPGGFVSAFNTAIPRERREQIQDRSKVTLQYDWDRWFVRPGASLIYYDLHTELKNPALASTPSGYQNYLDRYDLNTGFDLGWKFLPQMAGTLGYRYGHQYQQILPWDVSESSNEYQRLLAGFEGRPWEWLTVAIQGGPDFRNYNPAAPLNDHTPVKTYGEASLSATLSPRDSLSFKWKQWEWLSCLGKVPYLDSSYEVGYRRILAKQWRLDLGARICEADYTGGTLTNCRRDDLLYALSAGLQFDLNAHFSVDAGYELDLGRNALDNLANQGQREFSRQLASVGLMFRL